MGVSMNLMIKGCYKMENSVKLFKNVIKSMRDIDCGGIRCDKCPLNVQITEYEVSLCTIVGTVDEQFAKEEMIKRAKFKR